MEPTTDGRMAPLERVGLAVFLVVVGATQIPALRGRGFWLDEAFSIGATHDVVATLRRTSGTMAAFYVALVPWRAVSDERAWLRLLPLLFALAALGLTYQQAHRRWGRSVALVATASMASSVLFLRWSTELRSYSLALLAVTAGWFALLRWVDEDAGATRSRWRWVWAGAGLLAVAAHGLAAFQIAAQLGAIAIRPDRRQLLRRAWPALGGLGLAGALWLAGARDVGVQQLADRESLVRVWAGVTARPYVLRGLRTLVFAGAVAWGLAAWWRARERSWERLAIVAWATVTPVAVLALSPVRSYLRAPYLLGSLPGLALLVALAVTDGRWRRWAVAASLAALAVIGVVNARRVAAQDGEHWREAAAYVDALAAPGDALVVPSGYRRSPFDVGWAEAGGGAIAALSPTEEVGVPLRHYDQVADDLAAAVAAGPERVFVVGQPNSKGSDPVGDLVTDPAVSAVYEPVAEATFHREIEVVVLERR